MKKNESIQDKFSHFEPTVDAFTIDKSWEKIKYFVPQKEKKRRFFLLLPAFYIPFIALLLFSIGINSLHKIPGAQRRKNQAHIIQKQIHDSAFKTKFIPILKAPDTQAPQQTSNNSLSGKIPESYMSNALSRENMGKSYTLLTQNDTFIQNEPPSFAGYSPKKQIASVDSALSIANDPPLEYERLQPILLPNPDSSHLNRNLILSDVIREFHGKKANRLSIDVVGGVHYSFTNVKYEVENIHHRNTKLNYLLGVGLNYKIKNRLCFTGQLVVTKNNTLFEERFTGNKIVNKHQYSPTHVSSDTTYYVKTTSYHSLNSNYGFNLGLGMEYALFKKNKITLNGTLLLNTLIANYNYSISNSSDSDTLIYVGTYSGTIHSGSNSSNFKEGRSDFYKKSADLGIMPGIVIGYKLNSKTVLIVKPSFFLSFPSLKKEDSESEFSVKQNNLLLQLGIRFTP